MEKNFCTAIKTPKDIAIETKENINTKKPPAFDLVTGEILKQFHRKGIVKHTNLINASLKPKYVFKM